MTYRRLSDDELLVELTALMLEGRGHDWVCPKCGSVDWQLIPYPGSGKHECERCGARTGLTRVYQRFAALRIHLSNLGPHEPEFMKLTMKPFMNRADT